MIKRKGLLALAAAASIALAGCEIDSERFRGIHVIGLREGERNDLPIQRWYNGYAGIEAWIDGVRCDFSDGTYVLIEDPDKCPICDLKGD